MTWDFRPAKLDRPPLFIGVSGGTNSGKTWSSLLLARGIAGPKGKVLAIDTEGGRLSLLAPYHEFDMFEMAPPFNPSRFADGSRYAEDMAKADCLVIDSFTMEWRGPGGVLDQVERNLDGMGKKTESERNAARDYARRGPSMEHTAMVYSLLQRKIPIVFSMRATEQPVKDSRPKKYQWKPQCQPGFPFEITISFMLSVERRGAINLDLPHKLEAWSREIFQHDDLLSVEHGAKLRDWRAGKSVSAAGQQQDNARIVEKLIVSVKSIHEMKDLVTFTERPRVEQAKSRLTAEEWATITAAIHAQKAAIEAPATGEDSSDAE